MALRASEVWEEAGQSRQPDGWTHRQTSQVLSIGSEWGDESAQFRIMQMGKLRLRGGAGSHQMVQSKTGD